MKAKHSETKAYLNWQ